MPWMRKAGRVFPKAACTSCDAVFFSGDGNY